MNIWSLIEFELQLSGINLSLEDHLFLFCKLASDNVTNNKQLEASKP